MSQAKLEAELLTKDIRELTRTIAWMTDQHIDPKAVAEARVKLDVMIQARDRFLASDRERGHDEARRLGYTSVDLNA